MLRRECALIFTVFSEITIRTAFFEAVIVKPLTLISPYLDYICQPAVTSQRT